MHNEGEGKRYEEELAVRNLRCDKFSAPAREEGGSEMRMREWATPMALWVVLTALGEAALWTGWYLPATYAHEGRVGNDAFVLLARLAVPVVTFVLAVVVVGVLRYRSAGTPGDEGPPLRGTGRVYAAWLLVTGALAVVLIVNPGLVGLAAMRGGMHGGQSANLDVKVEGARWFWTINYPDAGVTTTDEMVLPVGRRVRFEVTSKDVIHSMWVPAFGIKIDAVPGRTTVVNATPDRTGSQRQEAGLRLQCAELCGIGHATMSLPVRVVSEADFQRWIQERRVGAKPENATCAPASSAVRLVAKNISFDAHCLAVPAGGPFTVTFDNAENVPHNVAIFRDRSGTQRVFTSDIFTGPATRTFDVPALSPGRYFFHCDLHPISAMSGILVVGSGG